MSKYHNVKTIVDGLKFDSRKEANYYGILKMRKLAGEIIDFKIQFKYPLVINNELICTYIADFVVINNDHLAQTIDVKGIKTPIYKLKKKLMKAVYGIDIIEV